MIAGTMHVEDGLRKLRQMENTTGIWTMRCLLMVERRFIVIQDKNSGEELERFPVHFVQEPTAIFKNDRREIYNNLILFTIIDESNKRDAQADMHIFQSVSTPAQVIVDEIVAAKKGNPRLTGSGYKIPPPPQGPAPEPPVQTSDPYNFRDMQQTVVTLGLQIQRYGYNQQSVSYFGDGGGLIGGAQRSSMMAHLPYREREDIESSNNELLERDVQLLNHCFDDVEKFVARLQQAAEAYKELEKRKRDRNSKNKKKQNGDGMLGFRARPPPAQDFVDIFQKFKLSFNLLNWSTSCLHPLSLIYEASRDPVHGSTNLGEQAVAPVLTQDAKQLLLNCLTSKEIELWQALGKNWTTSKEEWKGPIPPYVPRFYDGWQPAPMVVEEPVVRPQIEPVVIPHHDQIRNRPMEAQTRPYVPERVMPFPSMDDRSHVFPHMDDFDGQRAPSPRNAAVDRYQEYVEQHIQRAHEPRRPEPTISAPPVSQARPPMDDNTAYLEELRRSGAIAYEVLHDRQGKNAKELTVHKGEYLQVLDNSRNWWKVRNYKGEAGFCPYTILKEVGAGGGGDGGRNAPVILGPSLIQAAPYIPRWFNLVPGRKIVKVLRPMPVLW
ncbi:hypothetical protein C0Q70_19350 [Pomacea canaliculata]|uniref:SH3 domain-containing protein n=1 Tax=Pomacea canaliculata TaxID=400727 RepID=A0A2T7NJ43_POMCA|nr:hypothetical protein C0Q70_19350 [Pomacea canaliculata]